MSAPVAHEDFVDFVACLNAEGCDFIIVGAHALAVHGVPRATGDLDVLVRPSPVNAEHLVRALVRFGAPLNAHGITAKDFLEAGMIYQLGLPPRRIDVLTELSGVGYDDATRDLVVGALGAERVRFIGIDAMIVNKRAAGRPKDLADALELELIVKRRDGR